MGPSVTEVEGIGELFLEDEPAQLLVSNLDGALGRVVPRVGVGYPGDVIENELVEMRQIPPAEADVGRVGEVQEGVTPGGQEPARSRPERTTTPADQFDFNAQPGPRHDAILA
jgi:hypothetical protein